MQLYVHFALQPHLFLLCKFFHLHTKYIFISHKFYSRPSVITPVPKCECSVLPLSFNSLQNKQDFGLIVCMCVMCRWRNLYAIYSAFRRSTWNRNAIYRNFNSPKFIGLDNFAYSPGWNGMKLCVCVCVWVQLDAKTVPQNHPPNYARHKFSVEFMYNTQIWRIVRIYAWLGLAHNMNNANVFKLGGWEISHSSIHKTMFYLWVSVSVVLLLFCMCLSAL